MARRAWCATALAATLVAAPALPACGDGGRPDGVLVPDAASPVALVALPDGGLRYAERLSGRVRQIDGRGRLRSEPVAEVDVSTDGQRGLLGLAVDDRDRTFAAWTDRAETILVGQVSPPPTRIVWRGPRSAPIGNGGHLELGPDGRLVVSIGDRQAGDRSGRLLVLEPDGQADQQPVVLSTGWNNPFAFGFSRTGAVWIADNAPGDEPERVARLSAGGEVRFAADLPGRQIAPAGLVALSDSEIVLCGYLTAELVSYDVETRKPRRLAGGCRTSVVRLATGALAYAGDDEIRVRDIPPEIGRASATAPARPIRRTSPAHGRGQVRRMAGPPDQAYLTRAWPG